MVTVNHALEKRERNREAKAMTAAKLEKSLEQELVSRLKSRAYGDAPLNVNEEVWAKILEADRAGPDGEELMEDETDEEDEEELEREFISDVEESEDEEGFQNWAGRPHVRHLSFFPVNTTLLIEARSSWTCRIWMRRSFRKTKAAKGTKTGQKRKRMMRGGAPRRKREPSAEHDPRPVRSARSHGVSRMASASRVLSSRTTCILMFLVFLLQKGLGWKSSTSTNSRPGQKGALPPDRSLQIDCPRSSFGHDRTWRAEPFVFHCLSILSTM
jgi:Mak16 protein C-terminal region